MGAVIGIDDTDSRTEGMCTTYVGALVATDLVDAGYSVDDRRLVRLNPAIEHKTRGNAAVAIDTSASPETALSVAQERVEALAISSDPSTQPGVVVVESSRAGELAGHTWRAIRDEVSRSAVRSRLSDVDASTWSAGGGRGLIGAAAAVGAAHALDEWTVELIAYRESDRWGTARELDRASVFAAAEATYPRTWDTVDTVEGEVVCAPNTPGPVLIGLRGEDAEAVATAADLIDHEPVERSCLFRTNQGTDAHLAHGSLDAVIAGHSYRLSARVETAPETRPGGHVHLTVASGDSKLRCVAFEPTGRFRHHVRALRPGDRVTVCGEVAAGTLKLEKFALRCPRRHHRVVPTCPACERHMESAGRDQGYRCRACRTSHPGRVPVPIDRSLTVGWYEVPPVARRHLARPLVRGGFDAPIHPER